MKKSTKLWVLVSTILLFSFVMLGQVQAAAPNIGPLGTAGSNGAIEWHGTVAETIANLNDDNFGEGFGDDYGTYHSALNTPDKVWITWGNVYDVEKVVVNFRPLYGLMANFEVQVLKLEGNPTVDSDWTTVSTITGNTSYVTTHVLAQLPTSGVRLLQPGAGAGFPPFQIAELQVYGELAPEYEYIGAVFNIGLLGTAGGSVILWHDDSLAAVTANLNDGDFAEFGGLYHGDGNSPQRASITWGNTYEVEKVVVYFRAAGTPSPDFQIQTLNLGGISTNDSDWTTVATITENTSYVTTHVLAQPVTTSSVRIFQVPASLQVAELEVYGWIPYPVVWEYYLRRIADLQTQLDAVRTNLGIVESADINAAIDSIQTDLATAGSLLASIRTNLGIGVSADINAAIDALQLQLSGATTRISTLLGDIETAKTGLAEIAKLIGTPPGHRSSTSNYSTLDSPVLGTVLNGVVDMLLAPPGQNIRQQGWKE